MPILDNPLHDRVAEAVGEGLAPHAAARAAGYVSKRGRRIAVGELFRSRVAGRRRPAPNGRSWDAAALIDTLATAAETALTLRSPAGLKVAGDLFARVHTLQETLPSRSAPDERLGLYAPLSEEEWIRKFAYLRTSA